MNLPIDTERRYGGNNYDPLPVVLERGSGIWVYDASGRRYADFMSAYSALNHGHGHPRLVSALIEQAKRLSLTSRAFYSDRLGPFLDALCKVTGLDRALPMNSGAEAVETAIKAARRWGYTKKDIPTDGAGIVVVDGNFHGRTTTIVGFSSQSEYRLGFGPFTPGFQSVAYGDATAIERAVNANTCAVLLEPIQGESGVKVPPRGWLKEVREICTRRNVLLLLDEIQSGLGRTGRWFAHQHESIKPDGLCLGKALGGGLLPVSAFVASDEVMGVFDPGSHGSTFGGNPLAAAVGLEALRVIEEENLVDRSAVLGEQLHEQLRCIQSSAVEDIRGLGLWAGVQLRADVNARTVCLKLMDRGVLTRDTHNTLRLAPPLIISSTNLQWAVDQVQAVLSDLPAVTGVRARSVCPKQDGVHDSGAGQPKLLMCSPDHFSVSYQINPWMNPTLWAANPTGMLGRAHEQWRELRTLYESLGARVHLLPPQPSLPDLVFTANCAVVLDRKVLLGRYRHAERRGETTICRRFFESLLRDGEIDSIGDVPEHMAFEGAGDAVWDHRRQIFWVGYGPRTSYESVSIVRDTFNHPALPLALVSAEFYHLDTCMCVLDGGEILYLPTAFDESGLALLRDLVPAGDLIAAEEPDARLFALNAFTLGRNIIIGACSARLESQLSERGYRIHHVNVDTFILGGGSTYCLTQRLDRRSARDK